MIHDDGLDMTDDRVSAGFLVVVRGIEVLEMARLPRFLVRN